MPHKDPEAYRAYMREYCLQNAEKLAAKRRERYANNPVGQKTRSARYNASARGQAKRRQLQSDWRASNRERIELYAAKSCISRELGVPIRAVPVELAKARALLRRLKRQVKNGK